MVNYALLYIFVALRMDERDSFDGCNIFNPSLRRLALQLIILMAVIFDCFLKRGSWS